MGRELNYNKIAGFILVGIVLLFVIVGIFYTPYEPNAMNSAAKNLPPCLSHWFGTDHYGRDILSRVMEGSKTTFLVASLTVCIGFFFGTALGALTGYYGGWLDEILMRINDGLLSFPSILLALVFVSIIGTGTKNIVLALGILFIPSFARIVRSEFITYKQMDFVQSAKLMGAGDFRIMFSHILPNTLPILLSALTIGFNNAVLAESSMSYLGIGVQPPNASLGRMLSESQAYLMSAPWYALAPGLVIIITVLGFSLLNTTERGK